MNLKYLRERAATLQSSGQSLYQFYQFMPLQSDKWTPFAAIISQGHLPSVSVGIDAEGGHKAYVNAPSRTYADFVNTWGLQRGDQVTFVTVQKLGGRYEVASARILLNPRNADGSGAPMTTEIVNSAGEANGKFKVGEQAWYTHFRIGRVAPERYEGSQFPEGDEALEEFFCQMTPNTGNYDEPLFGKALSTVLKDVQTMTGKKSIYVTHSQGGRVGWATDTDNMAAIIAVEPGFAPEVGSDTYKKFVAAKIPMLFLFGDYIENGPEDIQSTGFWKMVLQQCRDFAKQYNADGGDATVIYLPEKQIHGNSHFMFQEKNNAEIADLIAGWLEKHKL